MAYFYFVIYQKILKITQFTRQYRIEKNNTHKRSLNKNVKLIFEKAIDFII